MAQYVLPIAKSNVLGGIKVGQGLECANDGTLNVTGLDAIEQTISAANANVTSGKALIASAITDNGVDTPADATWQQMATNITKSGGISFDALYGGGEMKEFTIVEEE